MKNVVGSAAVSTGFDNEEQEEDQLSEIQNKLIRYINSQPGIRYRELLRLSGLSNGVLTYHITNLEKSGLIIANRNTKNKITRYYPNNIPIEEADIIGHIRNNVARQIVLFILDRDSCTFNEIIKYTKKAPSTISWHLKRLKESGIIFVLHNTGRCQQLYKVADFESITSVSVNNYTEIMEDL